jgi:hypothetical protein
LIVPVLAPLRSGLHDAERDPPRERLLAHLVPALIELALLSAIHSFGHVMGRARTGAIYMKNGRSGVSAFWNFIQETALSVMSVMKL